MFALAVGVGLFQRTADASGVFTWNSGSGLYSTPTNWIPTTQYPGQLVSGDVANIVNTDGNDRVITLTVSPNQLNALTFDLSGRTNLSSSNTLVLQTSNTLTATSETFGLTGSGSMNQSAGTNNVTTLTIGSNNGSSGFYTLSNTGTLNVSGGETVGGGLQANTGATSQTGVGIFNQSGGTHLVGNSLSVGTSYTGTGTSIYNMTGGTLNVSSVGSYNHGQLFAEVIGYQGNGIFNQTGGTNIITSDALEIGISYGGTGVYNLNGPTAVLNVAGDISAGSDAYLGVGTGTFNVGGGSAMAVNLNLGSNFGATGIFNISGGTVTLSGSLSDGIESPSTVNQTGGTVSVTGGLEIGTTSYATLAVYNLNAGSLTVARADIGNRCTGVLTVSGGLLTVTGAVNLGFPSGTGIINMSGGNVSVGSLSLLGTGGSAFSLSGGNFSAGSVSIPTGTQFNWSAGKLQLTSGVSTIQTLAIPATGTLALNLGSASIATTGNGVNTVTLGGSLSFTNTTAPTVGTTFQIFNYGAGSISGGFTNIQDFPGDRFDISLLNSAGKITPITAPATITSTFMAVGTGTFNYVDESKWTNSPNVAAYPNNIVGTTVFNVSLNGAGLGTRVVLPATGATVNSILLGNVTLVGTAPDGVTPQTNPASLTSNGQLLFVTAAAGFNLAAGAALNIAGTGSITSGANTVIGGDANTQINVLGGAVLSTTGTSLLINGPVLNVAGSLNNYSGDLRINHGGTQTGTIALLGGSIEIASNFSASSVFNVSSTNTLTLYGSATAPQVIPGLDGNLKGYEFSGTLDLNGFAFLTNADREGAGPGLSGIYFDTSSHVNASTISNLLAPAEGYSFNDADNLTFGAATLAVASTFRSTSLNISSVTLSNVFGDGVKTQNFRFETTNTTAGTTVGTLTLQSGTILTGQDDGLPASPIYAGTFNMSGGYANGRIVVSTAFNWTGGVIGGNYGDVVIQPGAMLTISSGGGTIQGLGKLENLGGSATTGTLTVGNMSSGNAAVYQQSSGNTSVGTVFGIGNNGSLSSGGNSSKGIANVSGGTLTANTVLLGNSTGGAGTLAVSGTGQVNVGSGGIQCVGGGTVTVGGAGQLSSGGGIEVNTAAVTGGILTVTTGANSAFPELSNSIVAGYNRSGSLNVSGGAVTSPDIKIGILSGYVGNFHQTGGVVNATILSVGSDASITSGNGIGNAFISAGILNVGEVLLGSSVGGSGTLTVSGNALVNIATGLNANDAVVTGGIVNVQTSGSGGSGSDPVLSNSLVAGYERDGIINVSGGTIVAPYIKLGVTPGNTGSQLQTGGSINASMGMVLGSNGSSAAGTGILSITGGTTYAASVVEGSLNGGSGSITVGGTGTLLIGGPLTVYAGSSVTINRGGIVVIEPHGSPYNASTISSLAINTGGTLDITNNAIDLPGGSLATITSLIALGYNNGSWTGTGITSSTIAADTTHTMSIGEVALTMPPDPKKLGLFPGDNPMVNDVLVATTYSGDANLDGKVDGSDYTMIDNGFATAAAGWQNGDFNYDGVIDGSDFALIDNAFSNQGAPLGTAALVATETDRVDGAPTAAVPEPASAGALALATAALIRRRNRARTIRS